ncbi:MAG: hypothetical protein LBH91_06540 [Prevotellaceae bacterium]|nr:hypothetical protein [Prevotellaceae bacterium]
MESRKQSNTITLITLPYGLAMTVLLQQSHHCDCDREERSGKQEAIQYHKPDCFALRSRNDSTTPTKPSLQLRPRGTKWKAGSNPIP